MRYGFLRLRLSWNATRSPCASRCERDALMEATGNGSDSLTVVVVGGAALFIDHIRQAEVWVGTIVCLLASTAFVYLRHREQPSKAGAAVEADAEGGGKGVEPVLSEATPLKADAAAAAGGGDGGGCAVQ